MRYFASMVRRQDVLWLPFKITLQVLGDAMTKKWKFYGRNKTVFITCALTMEKIKVSRINFVMNKQKYVSQSFFYIPALNNWN